MDYNHIFLQYTFDPDKASSCRLKERDGVYTVRKPLREDGFYAVFRISESHIDVNVYEEPDGEVFLPFHTNSDGGFVSAIRAEVEETIEGLLQDCFTLTDVKAILLKYVKKQYGTVPEAPWDYLKEYHTLNTAKRHKWYGLFMLIPYRFLGIEKEGKINVLNLKADPADIPALIDHIHYFPAYHMNKKYWISILLDRRADVEHIKKLLDDSYAIVEKSRKNKQQSEK